MKTALKRTIIFIISAGLLFILASYVWYIHLEYYWHTETIQLYQNQGSIRFCNGKDSVTPFWNATSENDLQLAKAEKLVADGVSITIYAKGGISESGSEVFVNEITKIEGGINPSCEVK